MKHSAPKIWIFGDSFCTKTGHMPGEAYRLYLNHHSEEIGNNLAWYELLRGHFLNEYEIKCYGKGGASNDWILDTLLSKLKDIKKDDIIILMSTFHDRFMIPPNENTELMNWNVMHEETRMLMSDERNKLLEKFTAEFRIWFENSSEYTYADQNIQRFINILDYIDCKKYLHIDITKVHQDFETILEATNGKINDNHWSYRGHEEFCNHIALLIKTTS